MPKLHYRPSLLEVRTGKVQFIVLHHTRCTYPQETMKIDNTKYQTAYLSKAVMGGSDADINYNFIVEQIEDDVQVIMVRPFVYKCNFDDIHPDVNNHAVHVAMMGSYDMKIPSKRFYETLAYRCLNPLVRLFHINVDRIKFHSEVSTNKEQTCPGLFVDKEVIQSQVRRFIIKASL